MESLPDLSIFNSVGVVGLCVAFVVALTRGWIVPKGQYDDAKAQRDRALDMLQERTERDETILEFLRAIKYASQVNGGDSS